jgi:hypothetical protein
MNQCNPASAETNMKSPFTFTVFAVWPSLHAEFTGFTGMPLTHFSSPLIESGTNEAGFHPTGTRKPCSQR